MYSVSLRRQRSQRSTPEGPGDDQVRKRPEVSSEGGFSPAVWAKAGGPRVSLPGAAARRKGGA